MRGTLILASMASAVLVLGSGITGAYAQTAADGLPNLPQEQVECTGQHALCSFASDCKINGDRADCDCWSVDERHLVVTSKIEDADVKARTQARCTAAQPCAVDQAPVCEVIKSGSYTVNNQRYPMVSTYSYRGWCENWNPVACSQNSAGNALWADCMAAPCTNIENPSNPDRPVRCQCRLQDRAFVGSKGSCDSELPGGVISTISLAEWDFDHDQYRISPPGYDYVKGACATLKSDS